MKRKRRSRAEWVAICEAQQASGQSAGAFARQRGLNQHRLGWWQARLRQEGALRGAAAGFVEVVARRAPVGSPRAVVRVGRVAVEFNEDPPPAAWLAELASRC